MCETYETYVVFSSALNVFFTFTFMVFSKKQSGMITTLDEVSYWDLLHFCLK